MTANMEIVSGEKSGVLMVPTNAIKMVNGQPYVTTRDGRTIPVETGISSNGNIEIVSGINEGKYVEMQER